MDDIATNGYFYITLQRLNINPETAYYLVDGILKSDDIKFNEASAVRQILFMGRDIRTGADNVFIGSKGDPIVYARVRQFLITKLEEYVAAGYLVGGIGNPAYRDVKSVVNADKIYLEWTGNVSLPINFVFITNNFSVFVG